MDRSKFLGATDIPAVLGLSPWRTGWQVWAEKTGRLEPQPAGEAAEWGTYLEPVLLKIAESKLGPIQPGGEVAIGGTPIVCHPDGKTQANEPVEAKTSGLLGPVKGQWGEPGTDQIPQYYLVQALVQIAAMQAPVCHVPALLGGKGFYLYQVPSRRDLEDAIIEQACRWWREHVEKDVPPPMDAPPPEEVLKRIKRTPQKVITIDTIEPVEAYEAAQQAAKEAEQRLKAAKEALLYLLGDAEAALLPDGRKLTYFEQFRKGYQVQDTTFRVLRIGKGD